MRRRKLPYKSHSSKYKPLVVKRKVKVHKVKKEEKLPNINPSRREIWKITRDDDIIYKKKDVIANVDDQVLDMESTLQDLVQDLEFTFDDVVQLVHFLPSLFAMCKAKNIVVTNIPSMPSFEDYKRWKDEDDDV